MYQLILSAILLMAPSVGRPVSSVYARYIVRGAERTRLDPILISAYIHVESGWNPIKVSRTNDWGLGQIHVAVRGSNRFLYREPLLLFPKINIAETFRLGRMWKRYHSIHCRGLKHHWIAHFKWGKRVKDTKHQERVLRLYRKVQAELHRRGLTEKPDA